MSGSPRVLARSLEGHDLVGLRRHSPCLHAGLDEARRLLEALHERARERGDRVDEEALGMVRQLLPVYVVSR